MVSTIDTVHSRFDRSLRVFRRIEAMHRRFSMLHLLPGARPALDTMAALGLQKPATSRLFSDAAAARVLRKHAAMPHLERLSGVLDLVNDRRTLAARWWLHDTIDPATPRTVRGLEEALPARRRRIDEEAAARTQIRQSVRYQQHCAAAEAPGRLVTARCRIPRGPNTCLLTETCQRAG